MKNDEKEDIETLVNKKIDNEREHTVRLFEHHGIYKHTYVPDLFKRHKKNDVKEDVLEGVGLIISSIIYYMLSNSTGSSPNTGVIETLSFLGVYKILGGIFKYSEGMD